MSSKQLRLEIDLFVSTVAPIINHQIQVLGVEAAIEVHNNYRVGDRHSADCQAYNAMYRVYGCEELVRIGGNPERTCRYRL